MQLDKMSWGVQLWDKFDDVSKHVKYGIDFLDEFQKFLNKRINIEAEYARNLKKLCLTTNVAIFTDDKSNLPTYLTCFKTILAELSSVAAQHELVSNNMGPLAKTAELERKKLLQEYGKCVNDQKRYVNDFEICEKKLKAAYDECIERAEKLGKASIQYELDSTNRAKTRIDIDKSKTERDKKWEKLDKADEAYIEQLVERNCKSSRYHHNELPEVLNTMHSLDVNRTNTLKSLLEQTISQEQNIKIVLSKYYNDMLKSIANIDSSKDCEMIVETLKTGRKIPGDKDYIDLTRNFITNQGDSTADTSRRKEKYQTLTRLKNVLHKQADVIDIQTDILNNQADVIDIQTGVLDIQRDEEKRQFILGEITKHKERVTKEELNLGGASKILKIYLEKPSLGDIQLSEDEIRKCEQKIVISNNKLNLYIDDLKQIEEKIDKDTKKRKFYDGNSGDYQQLYQSPSTHSINSGSHNNSNLASTPVSRCSNPEPYVSSSSHAHALNQNQQHTMVDDDYESGSFDEDGHNDFDCDDFDSRPAAAAHQRARQYYQPSALASKAVSESDSNSYNIQSKYIYEQADTHTTYTGTEKIIGTCIVLYDYQKDNIASAMDIHVSESLEILERDSGDGWTLAQRPNGDKGYVPTQYIDIVFY